jgi:hypothetical protein
MKKKLEALRVTWEGLQGEYRRLHAELDAFDRELSLKYGRGHTRRLRRNVADSVGSDVTKEHDRYWVARTIAGEPT